MAIDAHFLFTLFLGFTCAGLGWFGRELWGAVKLLQKDLSALEVMISSEYVRYDRLKDALAPIVASLQEIKEALTHKADK